jgi:hypothetical protein
LRAALDTILPGTLDVVFVDVYAHEKQVLGFHFKCVPAERKRGTDAHVEDLQQEMREALGELKSWATFA